MPALSSYNGSDSSSSPRMLHERGSLRTLSDGKSQFIGSSSGVYFVNTVRRAFSDAASRSASSGGGVAAALLQDSEHHPSPEDCLLPDDESDEKPRTRRGKGAASGAGGGGAGVGGSTGAAGPSSKSASTPSHLSYGSSIPIELGRPPPSDLAKKLFMIYFQTWHQFFPFLHGPTLLKDMEVLYTAIEKKQQQQQQKQEQQGQQQQTQTNTSTRKPRPLPIAKVIILQCLFNLASLHGEDLPPASQIDQPVDVLSSLPSLAVKSDIVSIQALFAAQLLLVARMSLRTAAAVGGLLSRSIFLAGLHRCPARYRVLSAEDCDIRKRLFWSIYVIDRYLSQALGHPLGVQDSDVDVCSLAGPEVHESQVNNNSEPSHSARRESAPTPKPHRKRGSVSGRSQSRFSLHTASSPLGVGSEAGLSPTSNPDPAGPKQERHLVLAFSAEYSRLMGRALELFHKSIHVRSMDPASVLSLRTDVNAWWNALPSYLQEGNFMSDSMASGKGNGGGGDGDGNKRAKFSVSAFFGLLHSQIVLLINRPWLSLEPSSPEFHSALQTCIGVSRDIISILRKQLDAGCALFWPGYLSAAWMAGIILAFACHLRLYPAEKGLLEIPLCLDVLSAMSGRWRLARNCHTVLSDLQKTFEATKEPHDSLPIGMSAAVARARFPTAQGPLPPSACEHPPPPSKRRRLDNNARDGLPELPVSPATDGDPKQNGSSSTTQTPPAQRDGQQQQQNAVMSLPSAMWSPVEKFASSMLGTENSTIGQSQQQHNQQEQHHPQQAHMEPSQQQQPNVIDTSVFPHQSTHNGSTNPGTGVEGFGAALGPLGLYGFPGDANGVAAGVAAPWMSEPSALSNWDGGMPDVFAGATWESLLHVVNQDNPTWDDVLG